MSGSAVHEHLRWAMNWHFDPATGSPFWLERAHKLGFDPRQDVQTIADLRRFPDFSDDLRRVPAEELIPRGVPAGEYDVFDSGGTTGVPKRIVEAASRGANADWVSDVFGVHGFPERGNWLHVGPSGPHVVGRSIRRIAKRRNGLFFTIDIDPRWVRKLIASGKREVAGDYVAHLVDQVEAIVTTQDIRVLFITPPLLEAICERPSVYEPLYENLGGIVWAGTSASSEMLHVIEHELFPNARLCGIYGNTLMGIAVQRPPEPGDDYPCIFRTFYPESLVEIVDEDTMRVVDYGQRGRVLMHVLFRDMFVPNVLERDAAVRIRPAAGEVVDGIADVGPAGTEDVIEGVY